MPTSVPAAQLFVGTAKTDITPPPGTQIAGSVGLRRTANGVLDPLYARVVTFRQGDKKLCLVVLDVTILTLEITEQVRAAAMELGFEHDAVMVQATQTHNAPGLGHFVLDPEFKNVGPEDDYIRGGDAAWDKAVVPKIVGGVREATKNLRPVKVGFGRGYEERVAFNRRAVDNDGNVWMPWHSAYEPLGPTNIRYIEGPIDPEVGVVAFKGDDGRLASILVHHTCHPVNVFSYIINGQPNPVISADWPGAVCDDLDRTYGNGANGGAFMPAVINGACGDINPWPFYSPGFKPDHKRMGGILADMARNILATMEFTDPPVLDYAVRHIGLPVREVEPEKLKSAQEYLAKHPKPQWNEKRTGVEWPWMQAALAMSVHLLRQRDPLLQYEIQVLRIGDVAIVGLPGEPFAIGGIRVKMASPAKLTIIAHMTTQYIGYLPTKEAYPRGGHEVNTTYWAKFVPEALDMVVDAASKLVKDLFAR